MISNKYQVVYMKKTLLLILISFLSFNIMAAERVMTNSGYVTIGDKSPNWNHSRNVTEYPIYYIGELVGSAAVIKNHLQSGAHSGYTMTISFYNRLYSYATLSSESGWEIRDNIVSAIQEYFK